jgi:Cu2+-exporting ATPase
MDKMPMTDKAHDMSTHDMAGMPMADNTMMQHGGQMMHMGNLKQKFWVSLIASLPVLVLSPMLKIAWLPTLTFPGAGWVTLILATFLYGYGGAPFLTGAVAELKAKRPEMMTLIAIGITVSYFYSLYAFVMNQFVDPTAHVMDFFWELATLIDIMLLGHWIEMNAVMAAGNALQKMAALLPGEATVIAADDSHTAVPLPQVKVGDHVLVKAGEKIPADGVLIAGTTTVNESLVTGEARAINKAVNDHVIGGATNGAGTITVAVTGTGDSGYLAQVMKLVQDAQQEQSKTEGLADKVAGWLVYIAVSVALVTFVAWWALAGEFNWALERMVTVLVIACPHALGLAIPLVVARATSIGAKNGLLTRKRQALEEADRLDVVLLDKTGTLTAGNFTVAAYGSWDSDLADGTLLATMAALEQNSSHPLSVGILNAAKHEQLPLPEATAVTTIAGTGLSGQVNGRQLLIVNERYLTEHHIAYDQDTVTRWAAAGNTVSILVGDEHAFGFVAQGDQLKPESPQLIAGLKARGITPVMLTGDNQKVALAVAKQLGITAQDVHAELKPDAKERLVRDYQNAQHTVAMVGDGVNDAPSLARADIGIAIGAGTDVALDAADVVLVRSEPADILHFLDLAHHTNRKMKQNLWFGAGYNIIAIPLASGILAPWGILLSPAIGAVLMGLSTIVVAINAQTLKPERS